MGNTKLNSTFNVGEPLHAEIVAKFAAAGAETKIKVCHFNVKEDESIVNPEVRMNECVCRRLKTFEVTQMRTRLISILYIKQGKAHTTPSISVISKVKSNLNVLRQLLIPILPLLSLYKAIVAAAAVTHNLFAMSIWTDGG